MADSFFGFDTTTERDALDDCSDDDEEDYDALNDETFGGDVLDGDWEEDHEKLAEIAELSRRKEIISENGDLSAKIAAFIFDDEPCDVREKEFNHMELAKPTRPPPGFAGVISHNHLQTKPPPPLPNLKNMCTVEELERNLIQQQQQEKRSGAGLLQDIERNLISKPGNQQQQQQQLVSLNFHNSYMGGGVHRAYPPLGANLPKLPALAAPPPFGAPPPPALYSHPFAAALQGGLPGTALVRLAALRGGPPPPSQHHQVSAAAVLAARSHNSILPPPPAASAAMTPRQLPLPATGGGGGGQTGGQLQQPPTSSPLLLRAGSPPQQSLPPPPHLHHLHPHPQQQSVGGGGGGDEYAGLMTLREKQWLASIQLMQISTTNPFKDDYYYVMYQHRQSGAHGRKGNVKMSRETPTQSKATYTPLQFENSLGKLQVGSVMAPRKIIDTDVVESVEGHVASTTSKKFKQILLEIEQIFSSVLAAEEVLSPLTNSNPDSIDPTEVFSKAVSTLLKGDQLKTILSIRKGKSLVLRVLPHSEVSDPLARRLISVLPLAIRRDPEEALLRALPAVRHCLASLGLTDLAQLALSSLAPHLSALLENKCGVSVIANMMERAESLLSSEGGPQREGAAEWLTFLEQLLSASAQVAKVERAVVGIQGAVLSRHLGRLPPSPGTQPLLTAISIIPS